MRFVEPDIFYAYYIEDKLLKFSAVFGYPHMNDNNIKLVGMKSNEIFKKTIINSYGKYCNEVSEKLYKISQNA